MKYIPVIALIIFWSLFFLFWKNQDLNTWVLQINNFIQQQGSWSVFVFGAIYILATLLLLPCSLLIFVAGMFLGFWGLPVVLFFASIGASIAFFISRYFAQEKVNQLVAKKPLARAIHQAIATEGWKFLILLRLSPLLPFTINNYLLGTAPVRYVTYLWVTLVGLVPTSTMYIYLGSLEKDWNETTGLKFILFGLGLVVTLIMLRMTGKKAKAILLQQTPPKAFGGIHA